MIEVNQLSIKYRNLTAVKGISFHIEENEIFGIIGTNGAGKTSTIECMEGLRKAASGEVRICGLNPQKDHEEVQKIIGVQLQDTAYQSNAKVYELCELFSSFYPSPKPYHELLQMMGLAEKRKTAISKLSGGQRQKLSIVLALISKPKILFLDELTTGLDPKARHDMWDLILSMKEQGITIVLVSHFMDEVQAVCDRIAVMDQGNIIAMGTVPEIVQSMNLDEQIQIRTQAEVESLLSQLGCVHQVKRLGNVVNIFGTGERFVYEVLHRLEEDQISYSDFDYKRADLEEVYLSLVGKAAHQNEQEGGAL